MKKWKDRKLGFKLNAALTSLFLVIISVITLYTTSKFKEKILADTDTRMFEQLKDLDETIQLQYNNSLKEIKTALKIISNNIAEAEITITEEQIEINGHTLQIWLQNAKQIQGSKSFLTDIASILNANITLYQKDKNQYINIAQTTTQNLNTNTGSLIKNTIDSNNPIVNKIEQGQQSHQMHFAGGQQIHHVYTPLRINNKLAGILMIQIPDEGFQEIRNTIKNKKYFDTGYAFLTNAQGNVLIHPDKKTEGMNISDKEIFKLMNTGNSSSQKSQYEWDGANKIQYFNYLEDIDSYLSISLTEAELYKMVNSILVKILIGAFLA